MSSRQLKKISGYNETEELKKAMGLVDSDGEDHTPVKTKQKSFGFAALLDDDEEEKSDTEEPDIMQQKVI